MWWAPVQRILKWAKLAGPAGPCSGNHEEHICFLAERGDLTRIRSLTDKPAFMCKNCGRVAELPGSVCNPEARESIPLPGQGF